MRVTHAPARWIVCFLLLPAAWLTFGVATGAHAVVMIPAAVVAALLSATTAYRSDRGHLEAVLYFIGTAAMMGLAILVFSLALLTYYCRGGDTSGGCWTRSENLRLRSRRRFAAAPDLCGRGSLTPAGSASA